MRLECSLTYGVCAERDVMLSKILSLWMLLSIHEFVQRSKKIVQGLA